MQGRSPSTDCTVPTFQLLLKEKMNTARLSSSIRFQYYLKRHLASITEDNQKSSPQRIRTSRNTQIRHLLNILDLSEYSQEHSSLQIIFAMDPLF